MTDTFTTNFNFRLISFDGRPWHTHEQENWQLVDALLAQYLAITNVKGVWQNATAYTAGDRAIDGSDGTIWTCNTTHTSASTGTFSAARTAIPALWTSYTVEERFRGTWVTGTAYAVRDFVVSGHIYAVCQTAHTSGATFAGDVAKWIYLIDASATVAIVQAANLPASIVGAAGNMLRVNAGETGYELRTTAQVLAAITPLTTRGDIAYRDAASTTRLALGAINRILMSDGTDAAWTALSTVIDNAIGSTRGDLLKRGTSTWGVLGVGSANSVLRSDGTDPAYGAVELADMASMTDARLLGRSAGSDGIPQLITIGSGLSLAAGALSASSTGVAEIAIQVYTTATTAGVYTKPADLLYALTFVTGGGGGGAGTPATDGFSGSSGGAGGTSIELHAASAIGATEVVIVGAAGAAGAAAAGAGGTGGTSSFGSLSSATGGVGGTGAANDAGGAGGTGSGGSLDVAGAAGGSAPDGQGTCGPGGSSFWGGGAAAPGMRAVGIAGTSGGGGSSGNNDSGTAKAGGVGGPGVVVVIEFKS